MGSTKGEAVASEVITIDGGAGSGTSKNAEMLGKKLGCDHLNSGEVYRAIAWDLMLEGWTRPGVTAEPDEAARTALTMNFEFANGSVASVNGRECLNELHTCEINNFVPAVGAVLPIRGIVQSLARDFVNCRELSIIEGRATAWEMPWSVLKVWLHCTPEVAASRRGSTVEEILKRNWDDATRDHFPMKKHPDATSIDTSTWNVDHVSDRIVDLFKMKQPQSAS